MRLKILAMAMQTDITRLHYCVYVKFYMKIPSKSSQNRSLNDYGTNQIIFEKSRQRL